VGGRDGRAGVRRALAAPRAAPRADGGVTRASCARAGPPPGPRAECSRAARRACWGRLVSLRAVQIAWRERAGLEGPVRLRATLQAAAALAAALSVVRTPPAYPRAHHEAWSAEVPRRCAPVPHRSSDEKRKGLQQVRVGPGALTGATLAGAVAGAVGRAARAAARRRRVAPRDSARGLGARGLACACACAGEHLEPFPPAPASRRWGGRRAAVPPAWALAGAADRQARGCT